MDFLDVVHNGIRLDVSRVACNIVTGVGFLGAGTIFMYGNQIRGLVTSAGIWVMAAVGMAVGAGMYVLAIIATAITVVIQSMLSNKYFFVSGCQSSRKTSCLYGFGNKIT